jgi:uncharacterized delta-60 repeat protein
MKHILTYIALFISCLVYGQIPDISFGNNGFAFTDYPLDTSAYVYLRGIALQADGSIITTGETNTNNSWVGRHLADGSIDNSFGTNGWVNLKELFPEASVATCLGLTVQPDDKIIIVGRGRDTVDTDLMMFVARLEPDGLVDTTFGNNGIIFTRAIDNQTHATAYCTTIQPDGKILVGGVSKYGGNYVPAILRLNSDGSLDSTFDSDGCVTFSIPTSYSYINKLLVQPDGKIIGLSIYNINVNIPYKGLVLRYNADGSPDTTFGNNGMVVSNYNMYDMFVDAALQPDGKIVVGGNTDAEYFVARLNTNGIVDSTFGTNGIKVEHDGNASTCVALSLRPDGTILSYGNQQQISDTGYWYISTYRLHSPNGQLKTTFGNNGLVEADITGGFSDDQFGLIMPDSSTFICGGFSDEEDTLSPIQRDYYLVKYIIDLNTGLVDFSQTNTPTLLYPNPLQNIEHLKYTLANDDQISIVLLDGQGKLVATFVENEKQEMGDHEVELNLPNGLPSGNYFIQIASPKGKISIKAIK